MDIVTGLRKYGKMEANARVLWYMVNDGQRKKWQQNQLERGYPTPDNVHLPNCPLIPLFIKKHLCYLIIHQYSSTLLALAAEVFRTVSGLKNLC
jgi:hypothetical protein